jgi:hypothetical protein
MEATDPTIVEILEPDPQRKVAVYSAAENEPQSFCATLCPKSWESSDHAGIGKRSADGGGKDQSGFEIKPPPSTKLFGSCPHSLMGNFENIESHDISNVEGESKTATLLAKASASSFGYAADLRLR